MAPKDIVLRSVDKNGKLLHDGCKGEELAFIKGTLPEQSDECLELSRAVGLWKRFFKKDNEQ